MQDLNNYLMENFGKPSNEIAKTEYDNTVIDKEFNMISFDDVAEDFDKRNNEFNDKFSSADGLLIIFETEKFFFLVSKTQAQYIPFKNKSNRQKTIIQPLSFLKRFEPYHYNMILAVNKNGFDRYFYKRNKEYLN